MPAGSGLLDFGVTPADEASLTVIGQSGIVPSSHVEAFFMAESTGDNGLDEHTEAAALCPLACGAILNGVGFTIYAHPLAALGLGTFNVRWVWA